MVKEAVTQTDERKLRSILEEEGIEYEGRIVLVNGEARRNLDEKVPSDARIIVISPIAGG